MRRPCFQIKAQPPIINPMVKSLKRDYCTNEVRTLGVLGFWNLDIIINYTVGSDERNNRNLIIRRDNQELEGEVFFTL